MAKKIIKAQMKQRRDTRANWAATNPVLLDGELGIVSDDPNLYKVGDGTTAWNNLPFRGFDGTLVHETGTSDTSVMSQKAVTEALTDLEQDLKDMVDSLPRGEEFDSKGRYPDLSVGFADDLVGRGESVPAEFSFRASGGKSIKDGAARIKRLKGNSVVWNQKYKPASSAIGTRTINGVTFTISEDGTVEANGTAEGGSAYITLMGYRGFLSSHKYLLIAYGAPAGEWSKQGLYFVGITGLNDASMIQSAGYKIFQPSAAGASNLTLTAWDGYSLSCRIRPIFIDLTQMFGAEKEPSTIEEFYARKPIVEDEYAYNEGEVIHMTAEGIKSVGDNAFNGVWYQGTVDDNSGQPYLDNLANIYTDTFRVIGGETYCSQYDGADLYLKGFFFDKSGAFIGSSDFDVRQGMKKWVVPINADSVRMRLYNGVGNITPSQAPNVMVTLVHSGWKQDTDAGYQPYWEDRLIFDQRIKDEFPDGMSKWDMVYNKDGKGYIVKGTIGIKMTDFSIRKSQDDVFIVSGLQEPPAVDSNGYSIDVIAASYSPSLSAYGNLTDTDSICIAESKIWLSGSSLTQYSTAEEFSASLGDTMVWYKSAEPTIIEYDEPFNLDYKVADFGTEQSIAEQPSAPISADIIYQFNAVDMIREHEIEIAELQSIIATMQAQLASLTSNNG